MAHEAFSAVPVLHFRRSGEARLQVMLSPEELKALDNFRFEHRMPSRAAAVRELLRQGLGADGDVQDNTGIASGEYGVLKKPKGLGAGRNP